jgi:hypothetical protein
MPASCPDSRSAVDGRTLMEPGTTLVDPWLVLQCGHGEQDSITVTVVASYRGSATGWQVPPEQART